jgi:hypothetical protein
MQWNRIEPQKVSIVNEFLTEAPKRKVIRLKISPSTHIIYKPESFQQKMGEYFQDLDRKSLLQTWKKNR